MKTTFSTAWVSLKNDYIASSWERLLLCSWADPGETLATQSPSATYSAADHFGMLHVGSNPQPLLAGIEADLSGLSPLCSTLVQFWCQPRHSQQFCTEETGSSDKKSLDAWTGLTRCPGWRLLELGDSFLFLILPGGFETNTENNKKKVWLTHDYFHVYFERQKKTVMQA